MHISRLPRRSAGDAARAVARLDRVRIRNLRLSMSIGVHHHERLRPQPVIVNLEADCERSAGQQGIRSVVCYEHLVNAIKALAQQGHFDLAETLADSIAALCLADRRVHWVRVQVDKPEAISDADSVGVTVERCRSILGSWRREGER